MESPSAGDANVLMDGFGRAIGDLRLSVTDRCNLRCAYCIPDETPVFQPREELLTFEELERVTSLFVAAGVRKVRLTGGEPLLRRDIAQLVRGIAAIAGVQDLAMTTNGIFLERAIDALRAAGLQRFNISLDTLRPERFRLLTRRGGLEKVVDAIRTARDAGMGPVKVNIVPLRGFNDDEIVAFGRFACEERVIVRFIEFMPLEAGDLWSRDLLVPGAEIRDTLDAWKSLVPLDPNHDAETAERFRFADGTGEIGIIAPVTRPFCGACNRARITADGKLRTCLFSLHEIDLKTPLRAGAGDRELLGLIGGAWGAKEPGHLINSNDFVRPARTMSAIGG